MNEIDFQIEDNLCAKIIEDFNLFSEFEQMHAWLDLHKSLYNQINIQPKGLPAIANCNYEGVRYENIAKFHSLYYITDFEYNILDHKTHEEVIVYFFEQMNSYMIGHYLTEENYMGMDLPDFFYSLGNAFQELQDRGNNKLYTETLECSACNQKQYFFKGYKDDSYLHLIFKIENGIVKDLIECRELKCLLPNDINAENQVYIDIETPPF
jgi:hypothetical protein